MNYIKEIEYKALLFDFYGELLTEDQKSVFEDRVIDDLTVSEIAANRSVSRQAASDLIKRTEKILTGYEEKLHLVEKFLKVRESIEKIDNIAASRGEEDVRELTREILKEL